MAIPSAGDLRNFAVVGHASSGKTTLSEAMLACADVIGRMGNIAHSYVVIRTAAGMVTSIITTGSVERMI
jgi:translation elongation factor EF-G